MGLPVSVTVGALRGRRQQRSRACVRVSCESGEGGKEREAKGKGNEEEIVGGGVGGSRWPSEVRTRSTMDRGGGKREGARETGGWVFWPICVVGRARSGSGDGWVGPE